MPYFSLNTPDSKLLCIGVGSGHRTHAAWSRGSTIRRAAHVPLCQRRGVGSYVHCVSTNVNANALGAGWCCLGCVARLCGLRGMCRRLWAVVHA